MVCSNFYRNVVAFGCGGAAVASLVALALLSRDTVGKVNRKTTRIVPYQSSESGSQQASSTTATTTGDKGTNKRKAKSYHPSDVSLTRGKGYRLLGPKCNEGRSFVEYGATNESNNGGSE